MKQNDLSALPQIETLLQEEVALEYIPVLSRPLVTQIARDTVESVRNKALASEQTIPPYAEVVTLFTDNCRSLSREKLQRVVNATGILIHTNLGRSPLSRKAWLKAEEVNCGYSNLEFNLETGKRGGRKGIIPKLISAVTGSEDALIVNNNAAAVFLILNTFAKEKEVIVSRGEQVQIGGGFRIPDILSTSGATLVEVGTTNITTAEDYRTALSENTALILSVHRSNFAIRGFTAAPSIKELARIRPPDVLLCVDQGSGVTREDIPGEKAVESSLRDGADLVCFSGDKILGGPQAGIIVGKKKLIQLLEKHPLMRVFRPGKTIYALLENILIEKLNGGTSRVSEIFSRTQKDFQNRARKILRGIDSTSADIVASDFSTGGGSAPDETYPSASIRIKIDSSPEKIMEKLRTLIPPIIGVITDNTVQLNMASIMDDDIPYIREQLRTLIEEH